MNFTTMAAGGGPFGAAAIVNMVAALFSMASGLLAIFLIHAIKERQMAKYEQLAEQDGYGW